MKRHRWWLLVLGIAVVVGGCTLISAKHYRDSLVAVTVTSTVPDSIRSTLTVSGSIYYHETVEVDIPLGCRVEAVYSENEQFVEAGQPILKLKEEELQIVYCEKKLLAEELERTEATDGTETELAYWKKKLLDEELVVLENIITDEGVIYAEVAGVMIQLPYEKGMKTTENNRVIIGKAESGCYLEWVVPEKSNRDFSRGTATVEGKEKVLSWQKPTCRNGVYVYRSEISGQTMFVQGSMVDVQLIYVSEEYKAVLPKRCIQYDQDGSAYVYQVKTRDCNFGEESYVVKIGVTIEDRDDKNVAIRASLTDVVLNGSDGLTEMDKVLVYGE